MSHHKQRGIALVLALLIMLVMLVMGMAFMYEGRTQSSFNSAIKLNSFYRGAAENILRNRAANINQVASDSWVAGAGNTLPLVDQWRLGGMLKGNPDQDYPQYGVLIDSSYGNDGFNSAPHGMNAGNLEVDYRLYAMNNRDDPAWYLKNTPVNDLTVDETWDMDGKIVLTVQVFPPGDDSFDASVDHPTFTISAIIQSTGLAFTELGLEPGSEGDDLSSSLNAGGGSADETGSQDLSLQNFGGGTP